MVPFVRVIVLSAVSVMVNTAVDAPMCAETSMLLVPAIPLLATLLVMSATLAPKVP